MDLELKDRLVVITGASKGIGLACAELFAREGARVVGIARDTHRLHEASQHLAGHGLQMTVHGADLADSVAAKLVMQCIENDHGPVDVLVNCAGAARRRPVDELDATALHDAMQAKYFTYMHAIDPLIRQMALRGQGSIVNIVGQGGRQANPVHIGGGAANAALMLASVGYASAYASRGVRVNVINPGITHTERMEEGLAATARASGQTRDETLQSLNDRIPMGRVAEPEEIARVAVFLASPMASYVTGAVIAMDGGQASVI
ncbi:SDR family NAD(P)-dependent oxidoreductase [Dyella sp.]|uniref:SDR family NAD(P)-dependent oxidoreductase n=1 Tax=Dyella sp. TaxID=1869338 RepID=UPI002ED02FFD